MSVLSDKTIRELCAGDPPLIEDWVDYDWQLQSSGFDLSVARIATIHGTGQVSGMREENERGQETEIAPDGSGMYWLSQGFFIVHMRERLNLPLDVVGVGRSRTVLLRSGAAILAGIWDAGFSGLSQCGLVVHNPEGIRIAQGASLLHMMFIRLDRESSGFAYNYLYE